MRASVQNTKETPRGLHGTEAVLKLMLHRPVLRKTEPEMSHGLSDMFGNLTCLHLLFKLLSGIQRQPHGTLFPVGILSDPIAGTKCL